MASLIIGYDLNKPAQNYTDLIKKIEDTFPTRWHCLDSTWIVKTDLTVAQVRDLLKLKVDASDELLVAKLTGAAAWVGFDDKCSNWLRNNLPT